MSKPKVSDRDRDLREQKPLADSCPACGDARSKVDLEVGSHRYRRCDACGWWWLYPLPTQPEAIYGEGYFQRGEFAGYADYRGEERIHRRNARQRLDRLESCCPAPAKLIEIGGAYGYLAGEAADRGYRIAGVETSAFARKVALDSGLEVVASVAELAPQAPFDGVLLYQVLEHLPQPLAMLRQLHGLLVPDAVLHCETWDAESLVARLSGRHWQQISPPSVLHLFGEKSFELLLESAGFELLEWRPTSKRVGLGTVLRQLGDKAPSGLAGLFDRLAGSRAASKIALPYKLGDLVSAVARRRERTR